MHGCVAEIPHDYEMSVMWRFKKDSLRKTSALQQPSRNALHDQSWPIKSFWLSTGLCTRLTLCHTPLDRPTGKASYDLDEAKEKTCPGLSWCQRSESPAKGLWTSSGHVYRGSLEPGVTKQWTRDVKFRKKRQHQQLVVLYTTFKKVCTVGHFQISFNAHKRQFGDCGFSWIRSLFMAEANSTYKWFDRLTSSWYEASRPLSLS